MVMQLKKIERGSKILNKKEYTWTEKIHVYCSLCKKNKFIDMTGRTKTKNLVITCSKCKDTLYVPQEEIKDTVSDI